MTDDKPHVGNNPVLIDKHDAIRHESFDNGEKKRVIGL